MNEEQADRLVSSLIKQVERDDRYEISREAISFHEPPNDFAFKILTVSDWPDQGISSNVSCNFHKIVFERDRRHEILSGARFGVNLGMEVALACEYFASSGRSPYVGCGLPNIREEAEDGFVHGVLTEPFPWSELMEANEILEYPFYLFLLLVTETEFGLLREHGFAALEEYLAMFRGDVFDLRGR